MTCLMKSTKMKVSTVSAVSSQPLGKLQYVARCVKSRLSFISSAEVWTTRKPYLARLVALISGPALLSINPGAVVSCTLSFTVNVLTCQALPSSFSPWKSFISSSLVAGAFLVLVFGLVL